MSPTGYECRPYGFLRSAEGEPRSSRDDLRRPSESMAARTALHITATQT
jgi:hypothetical protein